MATGNRMNPKRQTINTPKQAESTDHKIETIRTVAQPENSSSASPRLSAPLMERIRGPVIIIALVTAIAQVIYFNLVLTRQMHEQGLLNERINRVQKENDDLHQENKKLTANSKFETDVREELSEIAFLKAQLKQKADRQKTEGDKLTRLVSENEKLRKSTSPPVTAQAAGEDDYSVVRNAAASGLPLPTLLTDPNWARNKTDVGSPALALSPVAEFITDSRPMLKWKPLKGASSYRVILNDGGPSPIEQSGSLKVTNWRPQKALSGGKDYDWQVFVMKDGQETMAHPARFHLLEGGTVKLLEGARLTFRLAQGVRYAHIGLTQNAGEEFRAVLKANPDNSDAKKFLKQIAAFR